MVETVRFGSQIYGYILLVMGIGCGVVLSGLFCRWFYKLFMPSRRILRKRSRIVLLLLISWPLLIAGAGVWACYQICYRHFYTLRVDPKQELVACYLWPKGEIRIGSGEVESIGVVRKGLGWKASDVLVIKTKSGEKFVSTAPVPEPEVIGGRIEEAIGAIRNEGER
jgi:hypothetical protein